MRWGDWAHFMIRLQKLMRFLPHHLVEIFAVISMAAEIGLGVLLIVGCKTQYAALGSGILTLLFGLNMSISFGVLSPLDVAAFAICVARCLWYCTL